MPKLKSCCFCFSVKTGTVLLGCTGIVVSVLLLIPHSVILENHEFYIGEFIKSQRESGVRDYSDKDIPQVRSFSRITWASYVACDVISILSSVLLIAGVATGKRHLLVPWLFFKMLGILIYIILILAIMFALGDINALFVSIGAALPVAVALYFWYVVHSAFAELKLEEEAKLGSRNTAIEQGNPSRHLDPPTSNEEETAQALMSLRSNEDQVVVARSNSDSTLNSMKGSIQRTLGGTPPPPYEVVAMQSKEDLSEDFQVSEVSLSEKEDSVENKSQVEVSLESQPEVSTLDDVIVEVETLETKTPVA